MSISEFSVPFRYKTKRNAPLAWIASHAWRQGLVLLVAAIGAIGNALLASVAPVQFGQIFANLTSGTPTLTAIARSAMIIGISQAARGLLQFLRNFGFELSAQRIERNVREEFYISLLGKSMTFHALQSVGDLMARATNDIREINFFFSPGVNMVFGSLNFLFVPLFIGWGLNPQLILVPLLFIIAYFIAILFYLRKLKPITDSVRGDFGRMNSRLTEDMDGVETVKAAAREDSEISLFEQNIQAYRDSTVRQGDTEARFVPLLLLAMAMGFGLLHSLLLFQAGVIQLADVITYFSALALLGFPTNTSIFSYSQMSLGVASARRLLAIMNTENILDENAQGHSGRIHGDLVFDDVSFSYGGESPVLEGLNFTVKAGQTVAIVGQTGSGKTTLAQLINRTYDPTAGSVRIDGLDLRDWKLDSLRSQISIIEQDIFLFSKTVRENIAFGRPGATLEDVIVAAKKAQAHNFIAAMPEGYETVIGERGVTLSGGQRQRLALARSFLTDPRILILDDSTSAIDSQTEDEIQKAIQTASQGRTTFIITHRLSQIRWADLIVVLRQGKIAAIGTHRELMQSSDAYRNIFTEL